jgi:hypothetical protein
MECMVIQGGRRLAGEVRFRAEHSVRLSAARTRPALSGCSSHGWVREGRFGYPLLLQMQRVMGPLPL